jgi:L-malate glycosyltransferase
MKIGIAGLMSLGLLNIDYKNRRVPEGIPFPMISHLVNGILKSGYKVVCYTLSEGIDEPVVFEDENITVCVAKRSNHPGRNFFKSERSQLVELMRQYPADIIGAHWSYEFAWAALDSGIPTVVTLHDHATTILKYMFDPFRIVRWMMNFVVLSKAKHLITNSEYLLNTLSKRDQAKAVIVNNFFENGLENYHYKGQRENYLVSVTNGFGVRKNIKSGLKAFYKVRQKNKNLKYHLVGYEMEKNGIAHKWAKKNGLDEGVEFLGNMPYSSVVKQIQKAKALIHPSREESFCNVILEALVLGTPVLGGINSGNVPYLLNHGKFGVLCDINNPDEIANGIEKLLSDERLVRTFVQGGFEFVCQNFTEDIIIERYISVLQNVYEGKASKKINKIAVI